MEGNIVGEPFEEFVAKQIDVRQKAQFSGKNSLRDDKNLQYLTNRNAWVKLASSVRIEQGPTLVAQQQSIPSGGTVPAGTTGGLTGTPNVFGSGGGLGAITGAVNTILTTSVVNLNSNRLQKIFGNSSVAASNFPGTKLPESAVLFNTLSTYTGPNAPLQQRGGISNVNALWNNAFAYGIGGTEFGTQPPPGIVSVQVDSLNRGSIRKANVSIKAHNRFQFDIIELLYLRLGFTMMLEWGWDKFLDTNGDLQQVENTIIETEWFTVNGITQLEMLAKIQKIREKYQGNVDAFFGKVSNFTWNFNPDGTYDITIDLITLGDVIESIKVNVASKQNFSLGSISTFNTPQEAESAFGNIAEAATLTALGEYLFSKTLYLKENNADALTEVTNGFESTNFIRIKPTRFITGTAGGLLNEFTYNFPPERAFYYVKLGHLLQTLQNNIIPQVVNGTTKSPQLQISSDELLNLISYYPNQIPLDPKVCIFNIDGALNSYGDITGINIPSSLQFALDPYIGINSTTNLKYGNLMNLYMNIEFISQLLISNGGPNQEFSLFKFLQDVCNGINDALGGVNKLEPVIKNDSTVVFIDQTLSIPVKDTAKLEVYGYNTVEQISNFVKDIKFVSSITPQLASMISIGATAAGSSTSEIDGTAFSKWNEELVDRFSQKIEEPTFPTSTSATTTNTADKTAYETKFNSYLRQRTSPWDDFLYIIGVTDPNAVKRYINDPSYPFDGKPMDFNTFYFEASKFDEERKRNNNFRPEDLKFLIDKNYGFYLTNAFGGNSDTISVTYSSGGRTPFSRTESFSYPSPGKYFRFDDTFISQGKAAYKNYINELNNNRFVQNNTPSSEIGFIPLSFDLVLDGISGIKIYNKLSINSSFLPSNYPDSLKFVITKVNHRISDNNWETSLSTISMPETQPYKYNPVASGGTGGTGGGNTGGSGSSRYTIFTSRGPQPGQQGSLQLLKDLIGLRETSSTSNYGIANRNENAQRSTTNVENLTFDELLKLSQLPDNTSNLNRVFAAGKFQVIPSTMEDVKRAFGFTGADKFTKENQEKIGEWLLLNGGTSRAFGLGRYLRGDNKGTEKDLEDAIQAVGQIWASFPIIKDKTGKKVGFAATGSGNTAYYGGSGANPKTVELTIKDVVKYMIQSRINYSNKPPEFIPIYY